MYIIWKPLFERQSYIVEKCELAATKFSDRQPKRGVCLNPLELPLHTGLAAGLDLELTNQKGVY